MPLDFFLCSFFLHCKLRVLLGFISAAVIETMDHLYLLKFPMTSTVCPNWYQFCFTEMKSMTDYEQKGVIKEDREPEGCKGGH